MADEVLLASARVYPEKLVRAGFHFKYERLDEALAQILG
jgi:NAD dependent epimerase/dehydratase family enzyme